MVPPLLFLQPLSPSANLSLQPPHVPLAFLAFSPIHHTRFPLSLPVPRPSSPDTPPLIARKIGKGWGEWSGAADSEAAHPVGSEGKGKDKQESWVKG
ncbi:hypothetical protein CLOM_g4993 [Closterium sp. NIES-68]|nr:hypothetical protein CLOM_g4993 [Closterium sp. NIES-68]GJP61954.1 hypothetical protein CLOP_g19072 [Closterium sp. NIES-67]